ncbi:SRPBCC family protein [Hyphomonas sp. ND6WE1B]|jgi:hypothetical protein|uniref:SRPBCC family protein n=1 Tax=Hyphomonas sp. ND6WE1B TaxID=1848191 RepID=UPI0008076820|nr:SRPBCC family protein [Hyphomonas sp. ND6WE1B]
MAKKLKQHKAVGEEYLATVGEKLKVTHAFPFPASAVWAALLDAKAWTEWLAITKVTWTSPEPYAVGTTRTVEIGDMVIDEVFFIWEEGKRMAFYFDKSTLPISAGVEDYHVVETPDGCELRWAGKASAPLFLGGIVSKQLAKGIAEGLPKLEALIRDNPGRFGLS